MVNYPGGVYVNPVTGVGYTVSPGAAPPPGTFRQVFNTPTTSSGGGGSGGNANDVVAPPSPNVTVNLGGGVTSGGVTSYGTAVVPGTTLTASQIQTQIAELAKAQGISGPYTATVPLSKFQQDQISPITLSNLSPMDTLREQFISGGRNYQPVNPDSNFPSRQTVSDTGLIPGENPDIRTTPYVKEVVTGYNAENVPTVKYVYVNPNVVGYNQERPATSAEIATLQSQQTALTKQNTTPRQEAYYQPTLDSVQQLYMQMNNQLKESFTYPIINSLGGERNIAIASIIANPIEAGFLANARSRADVIAFNQGIISDIKENPVKQIAIYGIGEGLGLGFRAGATLLPEVPVIGKSASSVFKAAGTALGLYATAGAIGQTIAEARLAATEPEAFSVLGVSAKDLALTGVGVYAGEKHFDILRGEYRTAGLKELEGVKQGEFPQASVEDQLKLFQENIYKQVSENPITFHTTPDVFYENGVITPKEGASELSGIYASTQISTPFSGIQGSSSSVVNTFQKLQLAVLQALSPEGKPGVAILEPIGFRESDIGISSVKQFEEQTRSTRNGGYAYFKNPPEQGIMEVPLLKTEIEAIARPKGGEYAATGKSFYVKIKGVKIPVDVFKYSQELTDKALKDELQKDIDLINKNYKALQKYGAETKLTPGHGGEHLFAVKENVAKLIQAYPELSKELIDNYGSLAKAQIELERAAAIHDLGKTRASSAGDLHGQRLANAIRSGETPIKLNERLVKAIEYHEKTFGATTAEEKILSTADRLDLVRFGKQVKNELLPLQDAVSRLSQERFNVAEEDAKSLERLKKEYQAERAAERIKPEPTAKVKSDKAIVEDYQRTVYAEQKAILRQQAEHEASLLEISKGRLSSGQKSSFIESRYNKLLAQLKGEKPIKEVIPEEAKPYKPESYREYVNPKPITASASLGKSSKDIVDSLRTEMSSLRSSMLDSSTLMSSMLSGGSSVGSGSSVKASGSSASSGRSSSATSSSTSTSSVKSLASPPVSSGGSSIGYPVSITPPTYSVPKTGTYQLKSSKAKQEKSLGAGYNVYEKVLKTKKRFIQINSSPLTKPRAKDVLAYFLDNSLVRTAIIKPAGSPAREDMQFLYVPEGYFNARGKILRNYRIKNHQPAEFDTERYIKRATHLLDTSAEKAQIKYFKDMQAEIKKTMR